jgi:hypothetical protein
MKTERQNHILKLALRTFEKATGFEIDYQDEFLDSVEDLDGLLRITNGTVIKNFTVLIKLNLNRALVALIAGEVAKYDDKILLVADYIAPQMADLLKKNDIYFIDAAGNAYINTPPLYIFIRGNKRPEDIRTDPVKRAFKAGGLKVIFTLLCNPDLIGKPFRKIAQCAGVALGTVGGIVNEMKELGYIIDMGKRGRKIVKMDELFKRWVVAYPEQLKPKQRIGYFEADQKEWWQNAALKGDGAYWGGEVAGAILTNYLKPKNITIYTKQPIGKIILNNRLKKDTNGTIEILNTFWAFDQGLAHSDIVHPILVYADLMETGDPRNIETAEMLYEKEIARLIRQN